MWKLDDDGGGEGDFFSDSKNYLSIDVANIVLTWYSEKLQYVVTIWTICVVDLYIMALFIEIAFQLNT